MKIHNGIAKKKKKEPITKKKQQQKTTTKQQQQQKNNNKTATTRSYLHNFFLSLLFCIVQRKPVRERHWASNEQTILRMSQIHATQCSLPLDVALSMKAHEASQHTLMS